MFFLNTLLHFTADCVFGEHQFNIGESFQNPGECAIYHCDAEDSISAKRLQINIVHFFNKLF